jgi:hypothetical protein
MTVQGRLNTNVRTKCPKRRCSFVVIDELNETNNVSGLYNNRAINSSRDRFNRRLGGSGLEQT